MKTSVNTYSIVCRLLAHVFITTPLRPQPFSSYLSYGPRREAEEDKEEG